MRIYLTKASLAAQNQSANAEASEATPNNSQKFITAEGHSMEIKTDAAGKYVDYSTDFILNRVFPKIPAEVIDFITFEEHVPTNEFRCKTKSGNYRIGKTTEITVNDDYSCAGNEIVTKKVFRIKSSLSFSKLTNLWHKLLAGKIEPTMAY